MARVIAVPAEPAQPRGVALGMKGSPRSLFLSGANRAVGWWMGHAANAVRQAQSAWMKAAMKPAAPKRAPRRRKPKG